MLDHARKTVMAHKERFRNDNITLDMVMQTIPAEERVASPSTYGRALRSLKRDGAIRDHRTTQRSGAKLSAAAKGAIAFIVSDVEDTFVGHVLRGILEGLSQTFPGKNMRLIIRDTQRNKDAELEAIGRLAPHVSGIIMIPVGREESDGQRLQALLGSIELPTLFVERGVNRINNIHVVASDNSSGGMLAAQHLLDLLEELTTDKFELFVLTKDRSHGQEDRLAGFNKTRPRLAKTVRAQNICLELNGHSPQDFIAAVESKIQPVLQAVLASQGQNHPAVGVFCATDNIALATMSALRNAGVRIPQDVILVGFDDLFSATFSDLTTVRQNFHELGTEAVRRLSILMKVKWGPQENPLTLFHKALSNEKPVPILEEQLIARGSTAVYRIAPGVTAVRS